MTLSGLGITNMKALVVLGNYGLKQRDYVKRVVRNIHTWKCEVDIVICTDVPLSLGGVREVITTCPVIEILLKARDEVFNNKGKYDLYVFQECDCLITWKNIESWLTCRKLVPLPYILGFMRYEKVGDKRWYPEHHALYGWDKESLTKVNSYVLCQHTNLHQASFVLDNELLNYVIDHPLLNPWTGQNHRDAEGPNTKQHYGPLERANADIFKTPGLKKVIPISHFDDFSFWHLPNRYIGLIGIGSNEMDRLILSLLKSVL